MDILLFFVVIQKGTCLRMDFLFRDYNRISSDQSPALDAQNLERHHGNPWEEKIRRLNSNIKFLYCIAFIKTKQ